MIKALDARKELPIHLFDYLRLVFASRTGVFIFANELDPMLIIGDTIIVI